MPLRFLRFLSLCVLAVSPLAFCQQQQQHPQPKQESFRIGFTGDLMGFYRDKTSYSLPTDFSTKVATEAAEGNFLLVGLGSNFGPEYGAALQLPVDSDVNSDCHIPSDPDAFKPDGLATPEAYYKGITGRGKDRVAPNAGCDFVADYLASLGYKVLTPGRYDLIYGTRWLRDMAINFRNPKQGSATSLRLLAANLVATPQSTSGAKPVTDQTPACPPLFSDSGPDDGQNAKVWELDGCNAKKADAFLQKGAGYSLITVKNKTGNPTMTVLVIGVVASDLLDTVASRHLNFCTRRPRSPGPATGPRPADICATAKVTPAKDAVAGILDLHLGQNYTIVLAQMPPADAEQLSISLGDKLDSANSLVLSQPDPDLATEDGERITTLSATHSKPSHTAVLVPKPGVIRNGSGSSPFLNPLSVVTPKATTTRLTLTVRNDGSAIPINDGVDPTQALSVLLNCNPQNNCSDVQKLILQQFVKRRGALKGAFDDTADFAFLQKGDFYSDTLPHGYSPTEVCVPAMTNNIDRCKRMAWLDTVLWRGDFMRKVAVSGKEMRAMLTTSKSAAASAKLVTYGIDTVTDSSGGETYYVGGRLLNDEDTYWAATSDDLAEGNQMYKIAAGGGEPILPLLEQHEGFISTEIAGTKSPSLKTGNQQDLPRFQLDIGKIYAGYSGLWVDGGDTQAGNFQGTQEKSASSTSYRNIDIEGQVRGFYRFGVKRVQFGLGGQGAAAFATTRVGNVLTQNQSTTWLQDTAQGGPFGQINLTRLFNVKSVYVNSVMITGGWSRMGDILSSTYPISVTDSSNNKIVRQVPLPKVFSGGWKTGFRAEAGTTQKHWYQLAPGTYIDAGVQWTKTDNLLVGMQLTGQGAPCLLSATTALSDCIKNDKPTTSTSFTPITGKSAAAGPYWDVNLIWKPHSIVGFTAASANGYANLWGVPANAPASQAQFSIPLSLSLDLNLTSNLTIGPVWKQYLFRLQTPITGDSGPVDTVRNQAVVFVVKWYFSRRTGVPVWRQLGASGPASVDQTKGVQGNAK